MPLASGIFNPLNEVSTLTLRVFEFYLQTTSSSLFFSCKGKNHCSNGGVCYAGHCLCADGKVIYFFYRSSIKELKPVVVVV